MQSIITRITRYFALICTLGLSAGAWGDASLVSYLNFDTIDTTGNTGVKLVRAGGSVDPVRVESGYLNYTTPANAKFGEHAYQSKPDGGAIGWRNNNEGLASVSVGFTISFWFHPNSTANYRSFFGFGFLNGKNYRFDKSGDALVVYESAESGNSDTVGKQLAVIPYAGSAWNHVAIVCQPGGSTLTVYVNATPKTISPSDISSTSLREVRFCYGRCIDGQGGAIYRSSYGIQSTWFDDAALFSGVLYGSSIGKIAAGAQPISDLMNDSAFLAAPVYKSSININFTNSAANGLTTGADVGLTGYAVPGTSWNNYVVANSTFSTVNVIDSTGAASAMSDVSVTISGTRGSHSCSSLTASSNPLHGYIDDNAGNPTPTVTVTGIPYYNYRVLVYHSTDTESVPFGYDTINGTDYTYDNGTLTEGTAAWGNSGAKNSANAIAEGGNVLVTEALSGSTLTVVGHRAGGASNARGCIAAIQIIEVKPEATENDLIIDVSGDTTYTVSEAKELSGTVYLTGNGTLTLDGSAKISAATINVGYWVTLKINADRLDATTFTGAGTVVYDGSLPSITKGFDNSSGWVGTVWVKNIGDTSRGEATGSKVTTCLGSNTDDASSNDLNKWGNAKSFVKFTNVRAYMAAANVSWTLILQDDSTNYAWYNNEGWTARTITIARLKGSGTFWDINDGGCRPFLNFTDASQFSGSIKALGKQVFLNGAGSGNAADLSGGRIVVPANQVFTVAANKTWHTRNGLVVNGKLNVNGTLGSESSTSAVSGSGTVVFGGVPSPTGNAWWKNEAWTGTVEIKDDLALNGDYNFNDYGNSGSTLKLTNCTGWLKPNYTCVPALEIGGVFTWNDGSSGLNKTFKVATLKGSGTISIPNLGAPTAVWQITDDWSGFTGAVVGNNSAAKRILVFGSTLPATATAGVIYVSQGATLNLDNASGAWWGVGMGFVVDGTVKASSRSKWGGGTYMTLGNTGVLELTSTGNVNDSTNGNSPTSANFSNVTGTGTIKYSSTAGWRAFSDDDTKMPASTVGIQVELVDSLLISKSNGETVIGSLSGSKNIRSDFNDNGANGRILTVTQSKDTEWQGKFVSNHITQFNVVAPATGTPGTLTLSGSQTQTDVGTPIPLNVSGSVNLTGTWVGATTVAGTFGGTGTLTGDLTFSGGSTFKAFASDENGLSVTGTVAYPAEGTVTVDVDALGSPESDVVLISNTGIDATKFQLKAGTPTGYALAGADNVLKLIRTVEVIVPAVENATVSVAYTVGGQEANANAAGLVTIDKGTDVTVTYTANAGYLFGDDTTKVINLSSVAENTEISSTDTGSTTAAVAKIGESDYKRTLALAVTAAKNGDTVTLLAASDEDVALSGKTIVFVENGFSFGGKLSGNGAIKVSAAPSSTTWNASRFSTVENAEWTGTFIIDWNTTTTYSNGRPTTQLNFNQYGIDGSSVQLDQDWECYFPQNASNDRNTTINPKVVLNAKLKHGNGTTDGSSAWTPVIKFKALSSTEDGVLDLNFQPDSDTAYANYEIVSLEDFEGVIKLTGARDRLVIDAVVTTGEPQANEVIVPIVITGSDCGVFNALNSDASATVNPISVTANVELGKTVIPYSAKAVYATINDASGLYYAVANIGDKYYATYAAAVADYEAGDTIVVSDATAGSVPTGWEITGNGTRLTKIQIPITWDVDGATTITYVGYGETPSYSGEVPKRAATAQYSYEFTGWAPAFSGVTEATTYTAQFSSTVNQYTVTIPNVAGATAVVKVGGAVQTGVAGDGGTTYTFDYGTSATVEWSADGAYIISGGTTSVTVENDVLFDTTEGYSVPVVKAAVAQLMPAGTYYADLLQAIGENLSVLPNNPDKYIQVLGSIEAENAYGKYNIGYDAINRRYAKAVASIGDAGYITLADAFAAAVNGQTIFLLADVSLTERLFVNAGATGGSNNRYATTSDNKSLTLNLNEKKITSTSNIALAGGSLIITGTGKISTKNSGLAPIEVRGTGALATKRTLTIGSEVTLEGTCYGLNIFGSNSAHKNLIDVMVNGKINGMLFVLGNLTSPENQINIVVNGTVDASEATGEEKVHTGIAINGNANVTVKEGATVKGESGIEVRSGTLTVNGGTITATAESYSYAANTNGTTTKGAAIAVAQYGSAQINATLNGGTLDGVKMLGVTDVSGNMSEVTVTAKSNTISVPTGYKWVESGTSGTYVLVRIKGFKFLVF